ncbi:hypothetical protein PTTG_03626 [Puccinia triticina 1-1 BBBD Race 1]|uniref:Matrin-type domain-containing protein n=1 Tax=Puccinia triticina (isolate 1-1 / race 1 (BBBD)) TaxID=630390 RepID=A0A180GRK4_PUCT1|nr:hypothetical protein PTTG_03626 [Puccinia triticina 1-1 BBBD Race 1]WAR53989.1 hypothetical protein PtB15_3B499 [Puccinia triticina]
MTEYWVSKQSYFCKYCDIFIRDDKPSRAQHENGLRHKGNLERYIRDIYKKEDRAQKERADEASQVSKIEKAARLSHQQKDLADTQTGKEAQDESEEAGEPRKRTKYEKADWKGAENVQNYSDARSLGFVVETELEEAARATEEEEARSKEGLMGKWEAVVKIQSVNRGASSSKTINREKIASQLTNDRDPDNKPIRKLFTERNLETETETLENMEVKVKVDRRSRAQKCEDGSGIHGSLQPIRLDGLQSNDIGHIKAEDPSPSAPDPLASNVTQEEDVKPNVDEVKAPVVEPPVFFKKRKATQAQPRQRT